MEGTTSQTGPEVQPSSAWELYNEKAKSRDEVLLKNWDSSIKNLPLFSGIFAAVFTSLCVESRKLLEADPLDSIDQNIFYIAQQFRDPSIPPPPKTPYEPPAWAILVNICFFTSLTFSIVVAVAALTCLQWLEEYDARYESTSTPKERAIRSHYRYRGAERWYMQQLIAFLPLVLYLAVGFFFIGLSLWFWQIHCPLASIPLAGFLIWATIYTATTLMAVFYPSAPYRTAASKALFRVIYLGQFYAWYYTLQAFNLYKLLLKLLRHFSIRDLFSRDPWNEPRNQYILEKIEVSRGMKSKLFDRFPWLPPGRDVHQSMHSHIRERESVARDETINISTLAWLASSIDLSKDSVTKLHPVLVELNNLPQRALRHWTEHNYNAPWSQIFKMVLAACDTTEIQQVTLPRNGRGIQDGGALHHDKDKDIETLAQVLQKMTLHPTLFRRMIRDLDNVLLIKFMDLLKSKRPTSSTEARRRLESITLLVSSKKWMEMSHEEQPIMQAFKIILDCLDSISGRDPHISTSWIFAVRHVRMVKGDARKVVIWPKSVLLRFIPDAFTNRNLRENLIILFLRFIDAVLCDSEPTASIEWRWKWTKDSRSKAEGGPAAEKHVADKFVVMRHLVHHLLRIFFTFPESQHSAALFNDLLSQGTTTSGERIINPALRLVVIAFGGHLERVEVPPHNDRIWGDPVWQYAVSVWFGFQTDYAVSNGHEIFDLVRPEESAKLVEAFRDANLPAFNRLIKLSTQCRSSKDPRSWNLLFTLVPNSEREISRTLSSPEAGLRADLWFQIFTEFQSEQGPYTPNSVTIACWKH